MDEQTILKELCAKEIKEGCYDVKIDGISPYSIVREELRNIYFKKEGYQYQVLRGTVKKKKAIVTIFISLFHIIKLFVKNSKRSIVFLSSTRLERINGLYLDKFVDPIIDEASITNYIILENGRGGFHRKPRAHQKNTYYIDLLVILAKIEAKIRRPFIIKKYIRELSCLFEVILKVYGEEIIKKKDLFNYIIFKYIQIRYYKYLFGIISPSIIIGASRGFLLPMFVAGRKCKIPIVELQHGITYGESSVYSGFRDKAVVPDYFFAFGNNEPLNVYGIEEGKIINVGFALLDYLNKNTKDINNHNSVLVISDYGKVKETLDFIESLALVNPAIEFALRPHPLENNIEENFVSWNHSSNICLQDRTINIIETLYSFNFVIGESSTVLYEALALGKRVGKLKSDQLHPLYLKEDDKVYFGEIKNKEEFSSFMNNKNDVKKGRSIYSPFNKKLFLETIK